MKNKKKNLNVLFKFRGKFRNIEKEILKNHAAGLEIYPTILCGENDVPKVKRAHVNEKME